MLAATAGAVPVGRDWTYEVKWDGYRTLVRKDRGRITLLSRNLKDATAQYPGVARAAAAAGADALLLDGEIVALDDEGRPSFQSLHHQSAHVIVFYAFDLLHLNGRDLMRLPLESAARPRLSSPDRHPTRSRCRDAGANRGSRAGPPLEGVVAKRRQSVRAGPASPSW